MTLHEFQAAQRLHAEQHPFYALLMAAMRAADTHNAALLREHWPAVWAELSERYDAPGALLPGEPGRAEIDAQRRELGIDP